jgi:hypothetical protein
LRLHHSNHTRLRSGGVCDWREDLWIEICRQLYGGELIPKTQADIERAMHQWISDHSHAAGGTTVRDRASKLWRAIKVEN